MSHYDDDDYDEAELRAHRESQALREQVARLEAENAALRPPERTPESERALTAEIERADSAEAVTAILRREDRMAREF